MSTVFISYASADRPRAEMLAEALASRDVSVWWDRVIPPGETWDDVIERELDAAEAVVVLWSSKSVESEWVRAEAGEAATRRILVPVLIEADVRVPLRFRAIQAADLIDWTGDPDHPGLQGMVQSLQSLLGRTFDLPSVEEPAQLSEDEKSDAADSAAPPAPSSKDIPPPDSSVREISLAPVVSPSEPISKSTAEPEASGLGPGVSPPEISVVKLIGVLTIAGVFPSLIYLWSEQQLLTPMFWWISVLLTLLVAYRPLISVSPRSIIACLAVACVIAPLSSWIGQAIAGSLASLIPDGSGGGSPERIEVESFFSIPDVAHRSLASGIEAASVTSAIFFVLRNRLDIGLAMLPRVAALAGLGSMIVTWVVAAPHWVGVSFLGALLNWSGITLVLLIILQNHLSLSWSQIWRATGYVGIAGFLAGLVEGLSWSVLKQLGWPFYIGSMIFWLMFGCLALLGLVIARVLPRPKLVVV